MWKGASAGGCTNNIDSYKNNPTYQLALRNSHEANCIKIELKGPQYDFYKKFFLIHRCKYLVNFIHFLENIRSDLMSNVRTVMLQILRTDLKRHQAAILGKIKSVLFLYDRLIKGLTF